MKKRLFLSGLLSLISISVFSQNYPYNPITVGAKIGVNLSNVTGGESQNIKPSFHAGGFVELPLSRFKKTAVQFELLFSSQGYKGKVYDVYNNFEPTDEKIKLEDATLNYINIPILFKYYISNNFSLELGPQFGYLVGASGGFDIHKANPARAFLSLTQSNLDKALFEAGYRSKNRADFYHDFDYGISGGFTANFKSGAFISARLYYGLADVYKADDQYALPVNPKRESQGNDASSLNNLPTAQFSDENLVENTQQAQYNFLKTHLDFSPIKNISFQFSVGYRF